MVGNAIWRSTIKRGSDCSYGKKRLRRLNATQSDQIGRLYDHNFLRFSTIFGEKIGVFLKNQRYDQNFA
jgi:hypothetical protein